MAGGGLANAWWNCRWRASSGSCENINCPRPTRRRLSGTCRSVIISKSHCRRKNPKAMANWVINNLRAKITETQTTAGRCKIPARAHSGIGRAGGEQKNQQHHRAGGFCGDVRHRRIARRDCRKERTGAGERHRSHRRILRSGHSRQSQDPRRIIRPAKSPR